MFMLVENRLGEAMAHEHNEECEALQEALAGARARQSPPQRDSALPGIQGVRSVDPRDITPDASAELKREIANLEQALSAMGCDPR